jgi:hypothetical protein
MSDDSACKSEEFKFPISRSDYRAILSGCPSVHCSIRPDDVSSRSNTRHTNIIRPDDVLLLSGPLHCIEKLLFQLASIRTFQQHVQTPLSSRMVTDSFQVPRKGRSINRSDDVVSRLDACLRKARIAIQN